MIKTSTSLKQLIQDMAPNDITIIIGTVISEAPFKIETANDDKMVVSENVLTIPPHLSSYTVQADITGGNITGESNTSGAGISSHSHDISSLSFKSTNLVIHNSLKKGDKVYMLVLNNKKSYYILDKVI